MAIYTMVSKIDGSITYKAYAEVKAKKNRRLRFTKSKSGFKTIEEAKIVEKRLFKECREECFLKVSQGPTWDELVDAWYDYSLRYRANNPHERLSPETLLDYKASLIKWTSDLGYLPATMLSHEHFADIFRKLEMQHFSRQHRRRLRRLISDVFEHGIRDGLIPRLYRNPVEGIFVGKGRNKRQEALTPSQIKHLIQDALKENHKWAKVWAFAYLSLMRSQEMYALQWSNVNFEDKNIMVNKSFSIKKERIHRRHSEATGEPMPVNAGIKETKTDGWHLIPFNDDLEKLLLELKSKTGETEFVFPRSSEWATNKLARSLRQQCLKLELPSICFHSLRACGATHLLQLGIEPVKVMKLGGWKSMKSMETYIRQSGIDVRGLNTGLSVLPPEEQYTPTNVFPFRNTTGDYSA